MIVQADTASDPIPAAPAGAQAYAGYINGLYQTYRPLLARFPRALVLPISVQLPTLAELHGLRQICFDVESGDLTAAQAPRAIGTAHLAGIPCPVIYGALDTWTRPGGLFETLAALHRGVQYQGFLAHPDGIPNVPAGFAAKQYLFGPDWDLSVITDPHTFYNQLAEEEIMAIAAAPNKDGRIEVFVEAADGSIWHTYQKDPDGAWNGSEAGVRAAQLTKLADSPGK